jgi:hypothetical protein
MLCRQAELSVIPAKMLRYLGITGGAAERSSTKEKPDFMLNTGT